MRRPPSGTLAVGVAILAVLVPLGLSIYFAQMRSVNDEKRHVADYAQEVLRRSEEVGDQVQRGEELFNSSNLPPCSPQDIDLMRQIDLGSSYIQMTGRLKGTDMICTSQGDLTPTPLGPADVVTSAGVSERIDRHLSRISNDAMVIISKGSFVAVADQALVFDMPLEGKEISLSILVPSTADHKTVAYSGKAPSPSRIAEPGTSLSYVEGNEVVAVTRSQKYDMQAVARAPKTYAARRIRDFILVTIPIGLLGGGALAWAVLYLSQIYFSLPSVLKTAARRHEFYLEYQPIVDLATRRWVGAEAFVRWKRAGKPVPPDVFIPIAEQAGTIGLITTEVMTIVARDLPRLLAINPDFQVSINLSGADLRSPKTLEKLDRLIADGKCSGKNIDIEVTERSFLQDQETRHGMAKIRERGFTISIDDFGTGYSNLASLQSLQIDTLKIDKAFVDTIGADAATSGVVLHIIRMAHALNLQMVAEGVETEAQARFLQAEGVVHAQGWLFSKSLPLDDLCELIPMQEKLLQAFHHESV